MQRKMQTKQMAMSAIEQRWPQAPYIAQNCTSPKHHWWLRLGSRDLTILRDIQLESRFRVPFKGLRLGKWGKPHQINQGLLLASSRKRLAKASKLLLTFQASVSQPTAPESRDHHLDSGTRWSSVSLRNLFAQVLNQSR
jgi:hypothetical protein